MSHDFPAYRGEMEYCCLGCGKRYPGDSLLYTCPECGDVLLLENRRFDELKKHGGAYWRDLFDRRAATRSNALRGVFRYYELLAPILEEEDICYLGEGPTPVIEASPALAAKVGIPFAYKNDGQNPSASFKDRGMACAFS
ncbi:MAG: threonine synthase, partial [Desulfovibrio sp.]|nr:threonine synthase [Desulfovibrio sp.]